MARSTTSELIMSLIDRVSGPARRVGAAVGGLNRTVKDSTGVQVSMADRIAAAQLRTQGALDRARIGVMETVGAYYLLKDAVTAPIRAAAAFETQLEDIGQKAGIPTERLAALGEQIKATARQTNQATSSIASAIDALIGRGAGEDVALAAAAPIGKAATAYRASTDDLASAAWAAVDNLKVPADQIGTVMDMMAQAGKEGAFELRDMAQYFPALGAAYQALGQDGVGSVADLAAALQVVRKGTGDSTGAATNLANVLQKIYAPATVKKFGEKGVDIFKAMEKAAKRGLSPIEAIAEITKETLGGDLSKIGYLFEDAQAQAGIRSLIQGMEEYNRIRGKAVNAKGVVDADYDRRVRTAAGAMDRWKASVENLNISLGNTLLPILNDVLDRIIPMIDRVGQLAAAHPEATKNIMAAAGALLAFKGALATARFAYYASGLGTLASAFWGVSSAANAAAAGATAAHRATLLATMGRVALRAAPYGALIAGLGIKPANVGPNGESEDDMLARANDNLSRLTEAERTALHDATQARAQAGLTQKSQLISTQARIDLLKDEAAGLREYIGEIEFEISNMGTGPAVDAMAAPLRDLLGAEKDKLAAVTSELASVEEQAAKTGAAVGGLDGINPTIKINMADLDSALSKMRAIRAARGDVSLTIGAGAPAIHGRRAKGGPVSQGRTYLVGEDGPEIVTPSKSGYVHPNGKGPMAGSAGANGQAPRNGDIAVTVNLGGITVHSAAGQPVEDVARTVMARMQEEISLAMRGVMADVSMG